VIEQPDYNPTEDRAKRAVELSTPAPSNHPYLVKKAIQPHGIGVLGELYKDLPGNVRNKGNVLVIPMQNVHGKVLSCQFIAEDGSKAYLAGKKRKGGFYYIKGSDRLWICEGFATGASLHEDTGDSVACAFDTGGLMPVTGALTALYPNRTIILMADDDWQTDSNPGVTKAGAAAQVNGIKVLQPDFTGMDRGQKDTDFNDLVRLRNGK
jgi:putative DNA primase/helicase